MEEWFCKWGPKGHGAELMINIAIVSMHAILYIDILGPNFVMSGGGGGGCPPPVPPPMPYILRVKFLMHTAKHQCSYSSNREPLSPIPAYGLVYSTSHTT